MGICMSVKANKDIYTEQYHEKIHDYIKYNFT